MYGWCPDLQDPRIIMGTGNVGASLRLARNAQEILGLLDVFWLQMPQVKPIL